MKAIGKAKGKAGEYTKDGLNLNCYGGCGHACSYCYVPRNHHLMRYLGFKMRQEFYSKPFPRLGIIEALKVDAKRIGNHYKELMILWTGIKESTRQLRLDDEFNQMPPEPERPEVFMSFATDPYQPINEKYQLTRQAIEILHENEIAVNILTKGVVTDFDLLAKRPDLSKVGVTFDGTETLKTRIKRLANLIKAKDNKIYTWVSFEPVIKSEKIKSYIPPLSDYVDEFKLGKWNYDPRANDIDWYKFVNEAIELLEGLGCKYMIKEDLRRYIK